ncbi:hypothetical protein L5515_010763 [Caenorhabditis briggsae]|uniref:Uncharacterized protein n=1 Tax=Caenorhabditis briggsae TaxID=6238 RepID=A0AAE9ETM1_CAEBR|nr:hypothetical protein L5515_010763 [Caenorhabditis briggsae]
MKSISLYLVLTFSIGAYSAQYPSGRNPWYYFEMFREGHRSTTQAPRGFIGPLHGLKNRDDSYQSGKGFRTGRSVERIVHYRDSWNRLKR